MRESELLRAPARKWEAHPFHRKLMHAEGLEHFLMQPKNTEKLPERLLFLASPEEKPILLKDVAFAKEIHGNQLREDKRTSHFIHVLRVAIRVAERRERIGETSFGQIRAAILHDTEEDTQLDPLAFKDKFFSDLGQSESTKQVFNDIQALNKNGKTGNEYIEGITRSGLWVVKGYDRMDSNVGDVAYAITNNREKKFLGRVERSSDKSTLILPYLEREAPDVYEELTEVIAYSKLFIQK